MPQASTDLLEQFARTHERDVTRSLQRHYGAKLSREDISDVLQETYLAASAAVAGPHGPTDIAGLRMWFYGTARHKAIDAIRGVEGRRYTRERDVSYDALTEQGATVDPVTADDHAEALDRIDAPIKAQDIALVHSAFGQLSSQHRELLRVTDMDEDPRSLRDAAALLGKSKSELARQRSRALQQLSILVGKPHGADCLEARSLSARTVFGDSLARRDTHLADCMRCQVSYGRRVQVLLPFLPLAMPGRTARLAHSLAHAFGRGDVPVEAVPAGIGAAGALSGGAAAKLAACAAAVAAIACVAAVSQVTERTESPGATRPAPIARVHAPRPPAASRPPFAVRTRPARAVETNKPAARVRSANRPSSTARGELSPESFAPATQAPVVPALAVVSSAPRRSPSPSTSTRGFSQEFTP